MIDETFKNMMSCSVDDIASKLGICDYTATGEVGSWILETEDRTFRVHQKYDADPSFPFEQILFKAFTQTRRSIGIDCDCYSFECDSQLFIVEESEKLQSINTSDCSLEEAIKSASSVTRTVEKNLGFVQIVAQLKQRFGIDKVQNLRVASSAKSQLSDFAIFEGQVVPINVENQFLALIDASKSWANNLTADSFIVETKFGKFVFGPKRECRDETELLLRLIGSISEWWLFPLEFGEEMLRQREIAENNLRQMHETNVKII